MRRFSIMISFVSVTSVVGMGSLGGDEIVLWKNGTLSC